ncbi:hypothetical protein JCM12298_16400 [Desulfothermus naphthae]
MSGIVGFFRKRTLKSVLANMLKSIEPRIDPYVEQYENGNLNIGIGLTHKKYFFEKNICSFKKNDNKWFCFYGEIYNNDFSEMDDIDSSLLDLEGIYTIVEIDLKKKNIRIISDKFGLRPIYYYLDRDGFYFSSQIRPLLTIPNINKNIDYRAFADFYHFGHVLGNKTLFKNIKLLPPASILTFNMKNMGLSIKNYWKFTEFFSKVHEVNRNLKEEVIWAFEKSVLSKINNLEDVGISLSGGLDSRAILAAMRNRSKGVYSYTLGLIGCQDEKYSEKMAKICGTKHKFLEIKREDLSDFENLANTLIYYSDGLYHPHESTEKTALDYLQKAPFKFLLRGHGGELAKASLAYPVQLTKEVFDFNSFDQVMKFIFKSANIVVSPQELSLFLTPEFLKHIKGEAYHSLEESISECKDKLIYPDTLIYYYLKEWIRRQVVASLSIFREHVEIRLPYLDGKFLKKLFKLPVSERYGGEIQVEIIKHCSPSLLKVPNSNTGAPLNASPLRVFITDKFNSLMKKLSIPGFRHYTEFERWQREYFKESIKQILFNKRTLERGLYLKKGLEEIFNAHITGKKNYARLLGTIVGLELWFRNFVD